MFTDDPAVSRRGRGMETLGQKDTETGRVEVGARSNDTLLGQAADFPGNVSQQIHWVGNDEKNRVRTVLDKFRDDSLEDISISLD